MSNDKKIILVLSIVLFLVINYAVFITTSSVTSRNHFEENNRVARETITSLQDNNRQLIQAVVGVGDITQKLGELGNSYYDLNREREEQLREREILEGTAREIYSSIGDRIQESFRIISEGQREIEGLGGE